MAISELVQVVVDGNRPEREEALGLIWLQIYPWVCFLANRRLREAKLGPVVDEEDVAQEACVRLIESLRSGKLVNQTEEGIYAYLSTTVARIIVDYHRRYSAQRRGGAHLVANLSDELREIADTTVSPLGAIVLNEMLDNLPEELRHIAIFRMMGYTNKEIAHDLDLTLRTVERRLEEIRAVLGREIPDFQEVDLGTVERRFEVIRKMQEKHPGVPKIQKKQ
jgi:RNA polymerase sigma factor (sigma-70 family)